MRCGHYHNELSNTLDITSLHEQINLHASSMTKQSNYHVLTIKIYLCILVILFIIFKTMFI